MRASKQEWQAVGDALRAIARKNNIKVRLVPAHGARKDAANKEGPREAAREAK